MKYAIEINNNEVIETLVFNGKEYKKKWVEKEDGYMTSKDADFSEMLDGISDVADMVYEAIDCSFLVSDLRKIAECEDKE